VLIKVKRLGGLMVNATSAAAASNPSSGGATPGRRFSHLNEPGRHRCSTSISSWLCWPQKAAASAELEMQVNKT
jgi:hypothetical protein